jgi:hypothetical protein
VKVPFEAGGRLSVQTNQVRAEDLRLSLAKLKLPSIVMNELTKSVNPLYDFDPNQKWPIAVNLNTADAARNILAMRGGLQWLGFNRDKRTDSSRQPSDQRNKNQRSGKDNTRDNSNDFPFGIPLPR